MTRFEASRQTFGAGMRTFPLGLFLCACVGEIDGGGGEENQDEPMSSGGVPSAAMPPGNTTPEGGASAPFTCAANRAAPSGGVRRLSSNEYRNTLRDLLAFALKDPTAAGAFLGTLPLASLPDESGQLHGSFSRGEQDVRQEHIQAWYDVGLRTGRSLVTRERLGVLLGPCATDAATDNDAPCLTDFVRRFGERAFRRPLSEEEVTFFRGFHGAAAGVDPAAVGDVVAGILMAPAFLYMTEHGETAVVGKENVFALSAFEMASRLSYHFWETMPDQPLWDAARSGTLKTPDGYARELDRIVADPRTRKTLRSFFNQWLRSDELAQLNTFNNDPVFKTFAGTDLPKTGLRDGMIQEVLDMVDYYVWDKGGGLDDLLSSKLVFPKSAELANLYGVSPWQGGEPPQAPGDVRPGILTRAAFLASGTANTRPIARGVFIRTGILCDEIPPPPNGDAPPLPPLSDKATTRQTVEALTQVSGSSCAGCHMTLINPLGFAMETFDGLGRVRTEQRLFSRDGKEIGRAPVDPSSVPQVVLGDMQPSRGVADLTRLIVESGKASACLARNYHRFTYARREDVTVDGCALERSRRAFARNGSLRAALRDAALGPEFKERTF